jgi:hypothetical protein
MKKILLAVSATLLLGGCVVNPYYDDDYSVGYSNPYRSAPPRYYEPCCYQSNTVIIRSGNYGYRPYGYNRPYRYDRPYGHYRPQPPRHGWGGHNNGNNWGGPRPGYHR